MLEALDLERLLGTFYTTVAVQPDDWPLKLMPPALRRQAVRRAYAVTRGSIVRTPQRELVRLAAGQVRLKSLTQPETGWASVDAVRTDLDRRVARSLLRRGAEGLTGVYGYEDCALHSFRAAKELGLACFYDLPIAYWQTGHQLLQEEAARWPEWEPTLGGTRDSQAKRARKTQELELADVVLTPSRFVLESLPPEVRARKSCHVVEFGSPGVPQMPVTEQADRKRPFRVLFAGSLTQRKGLADLFAAMTLLKRRDVELVVMGSPAAPQEFYRRQYPDFIYEAPRPHTDVLRLMQSCDVLALPSIVEGRALVQQEAMACGLALLVTPNAGGEDLVEEGRTGFLVPIRSPHAIAAKIDWLADHRDQMPSIRAAAREKAAQYTWKHYGERIAAITQAATGTQSYERH